MSDVSTATDDVEKLALSMFAYPNDDTAARAGGTLLALVQERDRLREALRDIARDASIKISEEIEWRITKARAALGE